MLTNPLQIRTENVHSLLAGGELVGDPTWLYPILLPSITDTLMGLYRAHYAVDNEKLSATLRDLNGKADDELCELLELQRSVVFIHAQVTWTLQCIIGFVVLLFLYI